MTVRRNCNSNPLLFSSIIVPALDEVLSECAAIKEAGCGTKKGNASWKWLPATDVLETPHAYIVRVDVPGVSRDCLAVHFDEQGNLVVATTANPASAESSKATAEGEQWVLRERPQHICGGSRAIKLGKDVDQDKVEARLVDGVLEITIGRLIPSKKAISIN